MNILTCITKYREVMKWADHSPGFCLQKSGQIVNLLLRDDEQIMASESHAVASLNVCCS